MWDEKDERFLGQAIIPLHSLSSFIPTTRQHEKLLKIPLKPRGKLGKKDDIVYGNMNLKIRFIPGEHFERRMKRKLLNMKNSPTPLFHAREDDMDSGRLSIEGQCIE